MREHDKNSRGGGTPAFMQPLVEVVGNRRVLVENHKGIISYGCSEIVVQTRQGTIKIVGNNLEILCLSKDRVVIKGAIDCVQF